MASTRETMKMICPNTACINKSVVFRKFDIFNHNVCKKCNTPLVLAKSIRSVKQDQKAKQELRELDV